MKYLFHHLKLDSVENFAKAMRVEKLLKISEESIFVGPQISWCKFSYT